MIDWPSVDLGWSGPGHLGDSVLLHVPLILQQASLGHVLAAVAQAEESKSNPTGPWGQAGSWHTVIAISQTKVHDQTQSQGRGNLLCSFYGSNYRIMWQRERCKNGAIKAISHVERAAFEKQVF